MVEADGATTVALVSNVREFAGPAAVDALVRGGARVYCHDRSFVSEVSRVAFAGEHHGGTVFLLPQREPEELVAAVLAQEGRLDAVVSNDVHPAQRAAVEEVQAQDFRAALEALMVFPLRLAGPHGISVNAIAPNYVANPTYFPEELLREPKVREKIERTVPMRRLGRSEETGALVAFLAGPDCGFMTGQVVSLSGGWS